MPRGSARASRASRSAGCPFRWTATIAFVLAVMRSAALSGDRQYVSGSASAKTGTARWCNTGVAEAMKVCAGTITSSPGPMSRAARAVWMAVVPELVATQWGTPFQAANASSKAATASPVSWVRPPERRASATALTSSSPRAGQGGNGFVRTFGPPSIASASAIGGRIIGQRRRGCTFRGRLGSAILRGGSAGYEEVSHGPRDNGQSGARDGRWARHRPPDLPHAGRRRGARGGERRIPGQGRRRRGRDQERGRSGCGRRRRRDRRAGGGSHGEPDLGRVGRRRHPGEQRRHPGDRQLAGRGRGRRAVLRAVGPGTVGAVDGPDHLWRAGLLARRDRRDGGTPLGADR